MNKPIAVKSDWQTEDMPFRKAHFYLERHFTESEIQNLKQGNIPQEMEDKWFWYFENDTLFAHRSWTGFCIYIIQFDFKTDRHRVTVNRNKDQYSCTDKKEDLRQLNSLLDWWVKPQYDYYNQWINETVESIQRSKNNSRN